MRSSRNRQCLHVDARGPADEGGCCSCRGCAGAGARTGAGAGAVTGCAQADGQPSRQSTSTAALSTEGRTATPQDRPDITGILRSREKAKAGGGRREGGEAGVLAIAKKTEHVALRQGRPPPPPPRRLPPPSRPPPPPCNTCINRCRFSDMKSGVRALPAAGRRGAAPAAAAAARERLNVTELTGDPRPRAVGRVAAPRPAQGGRPRVEERDAGFTYYRLRRAA